MSLLHKLTLNSMGIYTTVNKNSVTMKTPAPATPNKDISMTTPRNGISIKSIYKEDFMNEEFRRGIETEVSNNENPVIAFDTEFPGKVYGRYTPYATPEASYEILKHNVNNTKIIQLGLTLESKTPDGESRYNVWEFNFKDFNLSRRDRHNSESIKLLKQQGIDFDKNARDGIDSRCFSEWLKLLVFKNKNITWIGFHSDYDFGYMIKILKGKLPETLSGFKSDVKGFFGSKVYDLKCVIKDCRQPGLHGGLDNIARAMNISRAAGVCHQAGSDSLLTMQTYNALLLRFFSPEKSVRVEYCGKLFGLEQSQCPYFGSTNGCKSGLGNQDPFVQCVN